MAEPYVIVRAAVRYKSGEEMQKTMGFRLTPEMAAGEFTEQDPLDLDIDRLTDAPPPGLSYGDLPGFVAATGGAKTIERTLKDRLDDRLAATLLYDPQTKLFSLPGEDSAAFALRVGTSSGVSTRREALDTKIAKLERDIATRSQEIKGRKFEKWMSVLSAILANLNVFTGKSKRVKTTGMGGVLTKNRMENTAESRKESLEAQLQQLRDQRAALDAPDIARFETRTVKPAKTDVSIVRYELTWVY